MACLHHYCGTEWPCYPQAILRSLCIPSFLIPRPVYCLHGFSFSSLSDCLPSCGHRHFSFLCGLWLLSLGSIRFLDVPQFVLKGIWTGSQLRIITKPEAMSAAVFPVCVFSTCGHQGAQPCAQHILTWCHKSANQPCLGGRVRHSVSLAVFVMKDFCFVGTLSWSVIPDEVCWAPVFILAFSVFCLKMLK